MNGKFAIRMIAYIAKGKKGTEVTLNQLFFRRSGFIWILVTFWRDKRSICALFILFSSYKN